MELWGIVPIHTTAGSHSKISCSCYLNGSVVDNNISKIWLCDHDTRLLNTIEDIYQQ
jgi:hypothetical protein